MVNVCWMTCVVFAIVSFVLGGNSEAWLAASFVVLAVDTKEGAG